MNSIDPTSRRPTPVRALLILALAPWAGLVAAPVITTAVSGPNAPSTTTDELTFASDVSATDLLHGIQGSGGLWNANGSSPDGLNDGVHGGDYDTAGLPALNGAAWARDGDRVSFREFELGVGPTGAGFDIQSLQSITAWQGAGFPNQRYEVRVRRIGETGFPAAPLLTVDYQPFPASPNNNGGSTKVNVTDTTGTLASGVVAIRFDVLDTVSNPAGGVVMREIDVFGVPTDDQAPLGIVSLNPANNSTNVSPSSNLTATFNKGIVLGGGTITLRDLDTPADLVITLPDPRVSVSGAVLTVNPTANLAPDTRYAIGVSSGAIRDIAGNPFGGIDGNTTWNFTTAATPLRIMCLGDSITVGYTDNPSWANHPFKFGYRSGLYTLLDAAGYTIQFVGGSTEPWTGISGDPTGGGTYKPAFDLRDLGQDHHRGYGGQAANFLNNNIVNWLASDAPDLILLKIGTNSQDQTGLTNLVNTITTSAPNAHLIIAEIMPKWTYQQGIANYNSWIRSTLVPNNRALGRNVSVVDQYAPFLTNPADLTSINQSLISNGINHPDNAGYNKMAQVWFAGIEALGLGPDTFDRWIDGFPGVGVRKGFDDDADDDGVPNGLEYHFGTAPDAFSGGLSPGVKTGNTFTFTHPQPDTPARGVTAEYRWSKDLTSFHADAATDADGTTVTITTQPGTPAAGTTTVTATVTGTPAARLFLNVEAGPN